MLKNNKKQVRVRFAPSPTGFLHIGGLRTALYNYLFAKKNNGAFFLRIEDTDRSRYVPGGENNIIKSLEWAGIMPKEGMCLEDDKLTERGEYGPYLQSQRLPIYQKYIGQLIKEGKAYYCFCSEERLKEMRANQEANKQPPMYDEHCKTLSKEEIEKKLADHEPYVVRLNVPNSGTTKVSDIVHGEIVMENKLIDDQVLLKSDGFPTYHLAVVVDDHEMAVSHIIRGDEWLPSAPKHVLLYQAFGWEIPEFIHLPLLLNPDKSKLSKRQGDVSVEDYKNKGYLPEALLNFVALLGWNPGSEQEIFSLDELVKAIDFTKINKTGAVFNIEKLDWMNGQYIRTMNLKKLTELCLPYLIQNNLLQKIENTEYRIRNTDTKVNFSWLESVVAIEQERMKKLSEIGELTRFFFVDQPEYDVKSLIWKKSNQEMAVKNLEIMEEFLLNLAEKSYKKDILEQEIKAKIESDSMGAGETLWPLRVALTGREASPSPFEVAEVLGKELTLKRIKTAIKKLQ